MHIERRTVIFLTFMGLFFSAALYFTYYSKSVYLNNLPQVTTIMPVLSEVMKNGRYCYEVPEASVLMDRTGKTYLITARYQKDILGEHYTAARIDIWKVEKSEIKGWIIVEGIIKEEAVVTEADKVIEDGQNINIKNKGNNE